MLLCPGNGYFLLWFAGDDGLSTLMALHLAYLKCMELKIGTCYTG